MATNELTKPMLPAFYDRLDDFFRPWNDWFGKSVAVPATNIAENGNGYELSIAMPGLKKEDIRIDVSGNILTVSAEKEESKEEENKQYTRKEFNYSSFSRSFTLPDEVIMEKIDAVYENGVLKLILPGKEEIRKPAAKQIAVK
jgi:HSP20 family protein